MSVFSLELIFLNWKEIEGEERDGIPPFSSFNELRNITLGCNKQNSEHIMEITLKRVVDNYRLKSMLPTPHSLLATLFLYLFHCIIHHLVFLFTK